MVGILGLVEADCWKLRNYHGLPRTPEFPTPLLKGPWSFLGILLITKVYNVLFGERG
jgi:hypothetical protein